jgi:hypothetical protein
MVGTRTVKMLAQYKAWADKVIFDGVAASRAAKVDLRAGAGRKAPTAPVALYGRRRPGRRLSTCCKGRAESTGRGRTGS